MGYWFNEKDDIKTVLEYLYSNKNLVSVEVMGNKFTETISSDKLMQLPSLQNIWIQDNQFMRTISDELKSRFGEHFFYNNLFENCTNQKQLT